MQQQNLFDDSSFDEPAAICEACQQESVNLTNANGFMICPECEARAERYQRRREERIEHIESQAEKNRQDFHGISQQARKMAAVIPFGQPILVGHHSERRDRNYRRRIDNKFRKAYETMKKAEYYDDKAAAAKRNKAISSDDPLAIPKLEAKIKSAEQDQARMKAVNRKIRSLLNKQKKDPAITFEQMAAELSDSFDWLNIKMAREVLTPDFANRIGFASYMLTNNNANIRRMKKRLEDLQAKAQAMAEADEMQAEEEHEHYTVIRDLEDNRLRIVFDGKPEKAIRAILKAHGFHWSRYNSAWQRQLTNNAEYSLTCVISKIDPIYQLNKD